MYDRDFKKGGYRQYRKHDPKSRIVFGITLAIVGILYMLRNMGLLPHFSIHFTWPVILIVIGLLIGIKHNFRKNAWWILIAIGTAHLIPRFEVMGTDSSKLAWPAVIILAGIAIALRPRRNHGCAPEKMVNASITSESTIAVDVTFGGRKEIITSKDFKGGSISVTFAGCEINMVQADFTGPSAVLDCKVAFGSVEIIVPSHWEVINEINPSFGSVEDDRSMQTAAVPELKKTLILRGNCSFGSIELKSY